MAKCRLNQQEFALKRLCVTGRYILMTRWQTPDSIPGLWRWTRWRPVRDLDDVTEAMRRLEFQRDRHG